MQTAKFMGHGVCDHISKSVLLKSATDDPKVVGNECCTLARSLKIKPEDYRGVCYIFLIYFTDKLGFLYSLKVIKNSIFSILSFKGL